MFVRILIFTAIPLIFAYKLESGKEFDSSRYSSQGEKGEQGYIGQQQTEKGVQGHHDKENHRKEYAEKGGHRQGYNDKDGYYGGFHQGQKGRQGYHYEDHGKYAKGHKTKGRHNIHKLNDYKKNIDFFDEKNDQGFEEKHGGYEQAKAVAKGDFRKGGYAKKGSEEGKFGVIGFGEKGSHFFTDKGHKNSQGQDEFYKNYADFARKKGEDVFKNFGFIKKE